MSEQGTTKFDENKLKKLPIIDPNNPSKKYNEKEEKWLRECVTYEFMNLEEPGLMNTFSYGNANNNMRFTLFHGAKYKMPRFLAKHVSSKGTPLWSWRPDGTGSMRKEKIGTKSRFQMRESFE